ncbi:MAG: RlmE family RNA methyltransferase [Myxococcota bacterium]|nr:RlmE family RNA methyltransferase [Myxococcota bacterium]
MRRRKRLAQRSRKRSDHWTRKAKEAGYAARSVYKLAEIDKRFRIFRRGQRVLDLGCSPGSWSGFARERIGPRGTLVGIDLTEVDGYPGHQHVMSILEISREALLTPLGGAPDLVLSDMAPFTTGTRLTDHVNQLELARMAAEVAIDCLSPGGHFVVKVFDGEDAHAYVQALRPHFTKVRRVRPEATRDESVEFFLVCLDRRPPTAATAEAPSSPEPT